MEITGWTIYWITRLDTITCFCFNAFMALIVIAPCLALLSVVFTEGEILGYVKKWHLAMWLVPTLAAMFGWLLIPSTKQICAILVIPAIAQNEDVQALGPEIVDLARQWVEELKPNKE